MPSPAPAPPQDRRLAGIGMRIVAMMCLSAMFALVKLTEDRGVHLIEVVFYRQLFAALLVVGWVIAGPGLASLATRKAKAHIARMLVGLTAMSLNFGAVLLLPLAEATTFGFTVPIFATILSAVLLREATGIHRWSAVVIGFAGVLIVLQPGGHVIPLQGAAIALGGAILTASVTLLIRQLGATERTTTTVFWFSFSSLVPLGIAMPFVAGAHDPVTWAMLAGLGLTGGLGQLALTASLKLAPVSVVLPMDYTSLIWATLYGVLLFDVLPGPATWMGAPIIIGSGLYIVWREHRLRRAETVQAVP